MRRTFVFLLGAGILLGVAYRYVTSREGRDRVEEVEAQSERMLNNVRKAAGRIEGESEKRVDKLLEESR